MPISQELFDNLFLVMMCTAMGGILWLPTILAFLTVCTPKKLLDTYFKEAHFLELRFFLG